QVISPAMRDPAKSGIGAMAGNDPNVITKAASIFRDLNPQLYRSLEARMELGLAKRGACIMNYEATAPLGYVALGDILQDKFAGKFGRFNPNDAPAKQAERADAIKDYVRRRAQYAVISHEMGHSWGERHNFVSSSDPWNFRPQYWLLRTNAKKHSTVQCADGDDGKNCIGPRWVDPVTQNESKNLIHMWAQSSTMEYPGEPSQDLMALGRYDFGAARLFYGDTAAVYDENGVRAGDLGMGDYAENHQDEFGGLLGYEFGGFQNPFHYSQLDEKANLIKSCNAVKDVNAFKPATWKDEKDGAWHAMMDGHIVT